MVCGDNQTSVVVFDTDVLQATALQSVEFKMLLYVAQQKQIKVVIPQVVFDQRCRHHADPLEEQILRIKRSYLVPPDLKNKFEEQNFTPKHAKIWAVKFWTALCNQNSLEIKPFTDEHQKRAYQKIEDGVTGFDLVKDIEDAFIYEAVLEIVDEHDNINFLCCDNELSGHAKNVEGIQVFDNLKKFMIGLYGSLQEDLTIELPAVAMDGYSDILDNQSSIIEARYREDYDPRKNHNTYNLEEELEKRSEYEKQVKVCLVAGNELLIDQNRDFVFDTLESALGFTKSDLEAAEASFIATGDIQKIEDILLVKNRALAEQAIYAAGDNYGKILEALG